MVKIEDNNWLYRVYEDLNIFMWSYWAYLDNYLSEKVSKQFQRKMKHIYYAKTLRLNLTFPTSFTIKRELNQRERARQCVNTLFVHSQNLVFIEDEGVWKWDPGWRSRYSDWLRAGRTRDGSSSPGRVKKFLFSTSFRPGMGPTQPPIQWVPGALFSGVKRPGREADHSAPTTAEVKKIWIYTSTPPYAFMALCLIS
jgi:hypothetical protein